MSAAHHSGGGDGKGSQLCSPRSNAEGTATRKSQSAGSALRDAFDRSLSGMAVVGLDGRWLEVNDAFCRMLGYRRSLLLKLSYRDLTYSADVHQDAAFVSGAITGSVDTLERDKRFVGSDGSIVWAHVRVEMIRSEDQHPLYFVVHAADVTARHTAEDLLHDSERTLRAVIDNTPALISVKGRDHRFKLVNREFERQFGVGGAWIVGRSDAEILPRSTLDVVHARDDFVLNGGGRTQHEEIVEVGGRERVMLGTRFPLCDEQGGIQGVCITSTDITERRREERVERERLESSELIYAALAQDRFVLHEQPIVCIASGRTVTVELLIRMRAALGSNELLAPAMFLPAAERFDLIGVVDEWVIRRAVEVAAAGRRVAVNVSANTISDTSQVDRIEQIVIAGDASPQNIIFEITETGVATSLEAARQFAIRMRALGCAVALDDFGVGHAAFTYLRHLPVDYLKIDMQFIRTLIANAGDRQIVEAIVGVARQFHLETVAEGVEDQPTLDELRRLGVDYGQGFWLGRPEPLQMR